MSLPPSYTLSTTAPSPETYNALRLASGLTPFSLEAATLGLPNSLFTVLLFYQDSSSTSISDVPQPKGMGRVSGDAICVLPGHRGKGLGKLIMAEIENWFRKNVPKTGFVMLGADGEAHRLYEKFGFSLMAPASLGMSRTF